jgi:hypothetical protein
MVRKQDILENLLLIILCGIAFSCLAYGATQALIARFSIPNTGTLKAIGVAAYWSQNFDEPITQLIWPTISPGESSTFQIWIYNNGTVPVQLSYVNDSWNPVECMQYLNTVWDGDGLNLTNGQWLLTNYTLTASADCWNITSFSYLTTLIGTEI